MRNNFDNVNDELNEKQFRLKHFLIAALSAKDYVMLIQIQ